MSLKTPGSHWQGPLVGDDRAEGGLFEDVPQSVIGSLHATSFSDDFIESRAATYWTTTQLAAGGLVTFGDSIVTLSHNIANQGPSTRLFGTTMLGTIYSGNNPANNQRTSFCAVESAFIRTQTAVNSDFFFGLMTSVNFHPLDINGVPTVASISDGVGFRWVATAVPVATQWDTGVLRTLTGAPTFESQAQNTSVQYGIRIETSNSRDTVHWYINRRRVFSFTLATAPFAFSTTMTPVFGLVCEAGAPTYVIDYCVAARGFRY